MLPKGSIFHVTLSSSSDHRQKGRRDTVVVTATAFIGSVVTVAPTSTSARASLTRPEAQIEGRKCRILLEQMLAVDVARLTSFAGILDEDEIAAFDEALKLYHGLL